MTLSLIKTGAVAAAALALSATGAFAFAPLTGEFAYDTEVHAQANNWSPVVNYADAGDDLTVIGKIGKWYKVKISGPDGWVKKSSVDLDYYPTPSPAPSSPVQACFWGPGGYICIN